MKCFQKLCVAAVLTVAFSVSAFAGDTPYPGIASPLPQQSATAAGDTPYPGATADDPMTEVVLGLLQSVLSLF